jgi:hypothetical protein
MQDVRLIGASERSSVNPERDTAQNKGITIPLAQVFCSAEQGSSGLHRSSACVTAKWCLEKSTRICRRAKKCKKLVTWALALRFSVM